MVSETPDEQQPRRRPARRDVLMGGIGAALGAAAVGGGWAVEQYAGSDDAGAGEEAPAAEEPSGPPLRRYVSTQLVAPEATPWRKAGATLSTGLLFTTPRTPTFRGVIYDDAGQPVWIEPDGNAALDLRVQTYRGQPVLTYWTGLVLKGLGFGKGVLLDEQYRQVGEVRAGHGVLSDFHEFQLTEQGTALVTAYPVLPFDLSPLGGPADGWIHGAHVQEIDVETGEVLFDWNGMQHIDLAETHEALEDGVGESEENPFDPVHLNSVERDGEAFLMSARHTSTVYRVDRRTGEILWRFGGKRSDIPVPEGGEFAWQHDARRQPDGTITLYDNHEHAEETDAVSAALRFRIDEQAKTAELLEALRYKDRYGYAMGNAQYLQDGHVVVGWGMDPYLTEFDEAGEAVFELGGLGLGSYRSYRMPWRGRPTTAPDVGVRDGQVHMSWNGATELARWRVLAGSGADRLREAATVDRTGFETAAPLPAGAAYVAVEALDARGRALGRSHAVAV